MTELENYNRAEYYATVEAEAYEVLEYLHGLLDAELEDAKDWLWEQITNGNEYREYHRALNILENREDYKHEWIESEVS